jgi:hypothetical protein
MINTILTKLNFTVDITELREYYKVLTVDYSYLNWSWEKCGGDIVDQWRDAAYKDPANLLTHGWAIQSNLKDISLPCPPWNISKHETVEYRNTILAFGIIERLQQAIPYAYRWAVSVQEPGGTVGLHSDQEDELTVWIPIHTPSSPAITFVSGDNTTELTLEADGQLYLLDTTIPHYTYNSSDTSRATIIFRLNKQYKSNLLEINSI